MLFIGPSSFMWLKYPPSIKLLNSFPYSISSFALEVTVYSELCVNLVEETLI